MEKENVKEIIAKNLVQLRKEHKLTQQSLADKLNYSDKAVSRWEHGETLPDIETLCKICDLYGVRFEYLLQKEQPSTKANPYKKQKDTARTISISLIAICTVWLIATVAYAYANVVWSSNSWSLFIWALPATGVVCRICGGLFGGGKIIRVICSSFINWSLFIWALPATGVVCRICGGLFGGGKIIRVICSSFINWTLILSMYIETIKAGNNLWILFIVGIPIQLLIVLSATLRRNARQR